jgi:hypothetical protein
LLFWFFDVMPGCRDTLLKKVREWPVPSRDVTTKLFLGGNNDVITELFLPRGSLVSDIPTGDRKIMNLFSRCIDAEVLNSPRKIQIRHEHLAGTTRSDRYGSISPYKLTGAL